MHAKIVEIGNEVRQYRHRDCFKKLCAYIENTDTEKNNYGRIATVYGLRRSGKSILLEQAALKYPDSIVLEYNKNLTMSDLYEDIEECQLPRPIKGSG